MNLRKNSKKDFIFSYAKTIASAGSQNLSLNWWPTWLSSKNRYLSSATRYFEEIFLNEKTFHEPPKKFRYGLALISAIARSIKCSIKLLFQIGLMRIKYASLTKRIKKEFKGKEVYLIKTFAYKHSFKDKSFRDVYFETLPQHLKKRGIATLTIFDPIDCFKETFRYGFANLLKEKALPFYLFCNFFDLLKAWKYLIRGALCAQFQNVLFGSQDVSCEIKRFHQIDMLGANSLYSFVIYLAFCRISKTFNLSHFLFTFENNPWERLCQIAVKKQNPKTKTIGYQHSVLAESSMNMFAGEGELSYAPYPDRVLTVGWETAQIIKQYSAAPPPSPEPACALRFQYLEKMQTRSGPVTKTLLVALDGAREASQVIHYIFQNLSALKDWEIIIRMHPSLSISKLKGINLDFSYSNIELSKNRKLYEDLSRSGVVFYQGSSVALEALMLGLPIIHFDTNRILSDDPLFACPHLKWITQHSSALNNVLENILTIPLISLNESRLRAQEYLRKYFYPVTIQSMNLFI